MKWWQVLWLLIVPCWLPITSAQPLGDPDRGQPGDLAMQAFLAAEADRLEAQFSQDILSREEAERNREEYYRQFMHMLGLWPMPQKTPLHARVTGSLPRGDYVVDKLHFQSRPRLYVTANLYRPTTARSARRPAVLYVCGHSPQGRNGNKVAYQSHGIWFARHGYLCLMLDTLQLGEIPALHHGTYREQRWWWHSRGYTPAGVECWNGIRAIDYLLSRDDVDPQRIAVTGISGGGAATFWIAAADARVRVAVPVSGMADLASYVGNRVINGHCDCMFLYNTFQWPWTRIAGLVAPRPLMFVNSNADRIFPMDANARISNRMESLYAMFGESENFETLVSVGGHAYREDIRRATYRFINMHLRGDAARVRDSEEELVTGGRSNKTFPIAPETLRVFSDESDLPKDELNTTIDQHFVPLGQPGQPAPGAFMHWKNDLLKELRRVTFPSVPANLMASHVVDLQSDAAATETTAVLSVDPGIQISVRAENEVETPHRLAVVVSASHDTVPDAPRFRAWIQKKFNQDDSIYWLQPRGFGRSRWTTRNPPNYVERAHVLLGQTADTGRLRDVLGTVARLRNQHKPRAGIWLVGKGSAAVLCIYAALLDEAVAGVALYQPLASHMEPGAPQFLNVLRVCDVPEALGMLAPRPFLLEAATEREQWDRARQIYEHGLTTEEPRN